MLAVATLMHNNARNSTTGLAPNRLITGLEPAPSLTMGKGQTTPWPKNEWIS